MRCLVRRENRTHAPSAPKPGWAAVLALCIALIGCRSGARKAAEEERARAAASAKARAEQQAAAAAAKEKQLETERDPFIATLSTIETSLASASAIPACKKTAGAGEGKKRALLKAASVRTNIPLRGEALGQITSPAVHRAVASTDTQQALTALEYVRNTKYLVVIEPTKHTSPREIVPKKIEPGLYAGTGTLFDLTTQKAVCKTSGEAKEIGIGGMTVVTRGGKLSVDEQLDQQLANALLVTLSETFKQAVIDFGAIEIEVSER